MRARGRKQRRRAIGRDRAKPIRTTLFVFSHQDDESLISSRLRREVQSGRVVHCAYLTDGAGRGTPSEVRDAESRAALRSIGVPEAHAHFLGSRHGIPDQGLKDRLEQAFALLEATFEGRSVHRLFCPAWEGGHPDHDAAHLIALAFAARRGRLGRTWQFPAYHGRGLPSPLFRVTAPLDRPGRCLRRRITLAEGLRCVLLARHFPSQPRAMLLFLPDLFLRRVMLRQEILQSVDLRAVAARPHPGRLLYERLYGCSWEAFRLAARPLLARLESIARGREAGASVP